MWGDDMKMSVSDFQKKLDSDVRAICRELGTNYDSDQDRGWAFQLWFARLFTENNPGIDTDPEESVLKTNDLGVDIALEDQDNQQIYLFQCKFTGSSRKSKQKPTPESEVMHFAGLHNRLQDRSWVRNHASGNALDLLGSYKDQVDAGWTANYWFITTGSFSERTTESFEGAIKTLADNGESVSGLCLNLEGLKAFYLRSQSIEEDIPDLVQVDLPHDHYFVKTTPRRTLIASVKGTWLRNLYAQHKESLFSWNIRGYMGNRGLNSDISKTAEDAPSDFFYYNNGVSAICREFEVDNNDELIVRKLQIINGAQTVGSLSKSNPHDDVAVLFRLTETGDVNIEKGINSQIIRYNNTQNVIKISDFRSNDDIQKWLEKSFREARNYESLVSVSYLRKRGRKPGATKALKLEDLAKILYCFHFSPTRIYSSPRDLWTLSSYGGVYEYIFGVNGELPSSWDELQFNECLLALALSQRLTDEVKIEKKAGRDFMHRLRFHLLSLLGMAFRSEDPLNFGSLVKNRDKLDVLWKKYWSEARRTLIQDYTTHCEEGEMTLHAYMRSDVWWRIISKIFNRNLGLSEAIVSVDARESVDI